MKKYTIATLGGHSALEICLGAKKHNFKTVVIAQKGREKTYSLYFRNLIDEIILVDSFRELTSDNVINRLDKERVVFIPHRYCQVYCDLKSLENNFDIPIFGNKKLLKYEERTGSYNQYILLDRADIAYPRQISNPKKINCLVIVKIKEAVRGYERAFFFAKNYEEYLAKAKQLVNSGKIKKEDLKEAIIEEYLIGAQVNFNFFYSPLFGKLELLGTDIRRQTNIDGLIRLPLLEQERIAGEVTPSYIESGHIAVTVKESLIEKAFEIAEKLIAVTKKVEPPGIIGSFALQSAVIPGPPKEKIVVYDLSLRIPGSPGTSFTPYSQYLFGKAVSFGERIAIEIADAFKKNNIDKITT